MDSLASLAGDIWFPRTSTAWLRRASFLPVRLRWLTWSRSSHCTAGSGLGFTYQFDPGLGVFTCSTSSLGPSLAEYAQTRSGARRVSIGFAYPRLAFDLIENIDLVVPAVFAGVKRAAWRA